MEIITTPQARLEILEAILYYDDINPRYSEEFQKEIEKAYSSLSIFWKYEYKYGEVRTYRLLNYPYKLFFRAFEEKGYIRIEMVLHEKALPPSNL